MQKKVWFSSFQNSDTPSFIKNPTGCARRNKSACACKSGKLAAHWTRKESLLISVPWSAGYVQPIEHTELLISPPADTHSFLLPFSVGKLTTALWTEPHPQPSTWVQRVQCMPHGNAEIPFYCTHSSFKQKIIMHACHMVMQTYDSIAFTLFLNANKSKQNKKGHQNKPKLSLT